MTRAATPDERADHDHDLRKHEPRAHDRCRTEPEVSPLLKPAPKSFWRDARGVFAVEMAICLPLVLLAIGGFITIGQKQNLLRNTQFVVEAAAVAGPAKAQSVVSANVPLFLRGVTLNLQPVTTINGLATYSLASQEQALFPLFGDTVASSATVTVAVQP